MRLAGFDTSARTELWATPPFGETPFALSLSKVSYRSDTRDEGFDRLSPNGPVRGSVRPEVSKGW